jgi:hypothetical protein
VTGPTLVIVSGPPGSGKTTLAHKLAAALGCPAISRDEIKQGMAHAVPGFAPAPGDELTQRTLPVFFAVLDLLLRAGVTTVAEAAFQDHVWRPRLGIVRHMAEVERNWFRPVLGGEPMATIFAPGMLRERLDGSTGQLRPGNYDRAITTGQLRPGDYGSRTYP